MQMQTVEHIVTPTAERAIVPIPESQAYLGGIGLSKLYELIRQGELVKVNIGRRGFITLESLRAYVDRLIEAA
jgi:hypothetical protein